MSDEQFPDVSTDMLIDFIDPFILSGRITGKIIIDNILVHQTMQQNRTDETLHLYDEHGFSIEMSPYGAVRVKEVDDRVREWLKEPDHTMKPLVAREQSVWYCIPIPGREYNDEQILQMRANLSRMWGRALVSGGRFLLGNFIHYNDRYVHAETGETKNTLTGAESYDRAWKRNPLYRGDSIPNHDIVARGNYSDPENPEWKEKYADGIADFLLDGMDKRLALRLKALEDKNTGVIRPAPGPISG